ncbi:MAG TPA: hypothetical protein VHG90_01010 [Acidimicrobiales bacterium]|nr:hypothetical protein [Acidimicrobiales bacterium]
MVVVVVRLGQQFLGLLDLALLDERCRGHVVVEGGELEEDPTEWGEGGADPIGLLGQPPVGLFQLLGLVERRLVDTERAQHATDWRCGKRGQPRRLLPELAAGIDPLLVRLRRGLLLLGVVGHRIRVRAASATVRALGSSSANAPVFGRFQPAV